MHYIFWNNYITSHWPLNQVQKYQTIVVYCKCFQVPSVLAHSRLPGVFCTCCSFTGRNHYRDWSIINTCLAGVTNQLSQEDSCKNYLTVTNTFKYSKWENACQSYKPPNIYFEEDFKKRNKCLRSSQGTHFCRHILCTDFFRLFYLMLKVWVFSVYLSLSMGWLDFESYHPASTVNQLGTVFLYIPHLLR